jgi:hypothetical protein
MPVQRRENFKLKHSLSLVVSQFGDQNIETVVMPAKAGIHIENGTNLDSGLKGIPLGLSPERHVKNETDPLPFLSLKSRSPISML